MSDRAADFTGSIPAFYDHGLGPVFFADFADDIARRVAASAPTRVLEIAAGTGIVTRRLRDLLPREAHLTATDLNPPMLEVARAKIPPAMKWSSFSPPMPPPCRSLMPVSMRLCASSGSCSFPDKDKGHREAHRVLVGGGRYLFSVWDSHRHNPIGRLITEILAGLFPHDPPQFYQVPFSYHRIDPIKDSLDAAGFTDLRIAVLSLSKIVPDVATYARALVLGNPLIDQIRARGGVDPERVIEAACRSTTSRIRHRSDAYPSPSDRVRGYASITFCSRKIPHDLMAIRSIDDSRD